MSAGTGTPINSEFPIHYVARYGYVWRPGLQRGLSMPGNPPTVLRYVTTPDRRTVDYFGDRKVRINFLNRFYIDLTSILLNVSLLAALWFFLFYLLSNWFSFRLTEQAPKMEAQQRSTPCNQNS